MTHKTIYSEKRLRKIYSRENRVGKFVWGKCAIINNAWRDDFATDCMYEMLNGPTLSFREILRRSAHSSVLPAHPSRSAKPSLEGSESVC